MEQGETWLMLSVIPDKGLSDAQASSEYIPPLVFVLAAASVFYHRRRNLDQEQKPCGKRHSVITGHVPGLGL